jgi:hypothetical protein
MVTGCLRFSLHAPTRIGECDVMIIFRIRTGVGRRVQTAQSIEKLGVVVVIGWRFSFYAPTRTRKWRNVCMPLCRRRRIFWFLIAGSVIRSLLKLAIECLVRSILLCDNFFVGNRSREQCCNPCWHWTPLRDCFLALFFMGVVVEVSGLPAVFRVSLAFPLASVFAANLSIHFTRLSSITPRLGHGLFSAQLLAACSTNMPRL